MTLKNSHLLYILEVISYLKPALECTFRFASLMFLIKKLLQNRFSRKFYITYFGFHTLVVSLILISS